MEQSLAVFLRGTDEILPIDELKKIARIVTTKKSGEGVLEGLDMIKSEFEM